MTIIQVIICIIRSTSFLNFILNVKISFSEEKTVVQNPSIILF